MKPAGQKGKLYAFPLINTKYPANLLRKTLYAVTY